MPLTSTRPELAGTFGMVATTHWLASQTGMSVLERGGNAVDAAAAAGFVLQVVEPHLNGPGGDLPALLWSAADRRAHVVCGQGTAPAAATPEAFAALGLSAVPGTGPLAATVPGAFGGWVRMLQQWGTWPLRDVLAPAISYARDGAPALPRVAATVARMAPLFEADWPTSAAVWTAGGAPAPWGRVRLTALADTYERVLAEAEAAGGDRDARLVAALDAWYRGFVAEAIEDFCAGTPWRDSSGERHTGLLRGSDLAGWEPTVEEPARGSYRGVEVLKTGPWGQGPVMLQQLRLLDGLDLGALDDGDPDWVHRVTEVSKLAFADREAWYGDPDHADVPLADLLSRAYADERRALVDDAHADLALRPGSPGGREPRLARPLPAATGSGAGVGEPTVSREDAPADTAQPTGDTCHVDVVDRWGTMVSATPSGGWLQSSPVVPGLGFPLGTRAQMFWLEQGLPSSLRPGARPRTTLSPSLALRDGEPWLAFGTPGGDQQDQWSLVLLLRAVHAAERRGAGGWTGLQAALDAPMFHSEHAPSSFYPRGSRPGRLVVEDRFPAAVVAELARRGHDVEVVDGWSLGRTSAVARDGGWLRAAANARGEQGYAVGR